MYQPRAPPTYLFIEKSQIKTALLTKYEEMRPERPLVEL
jgi:hypothetical protein